MARLVVSLRQRCRVIDAFARGPEPSADFRGARSSTYARSAKSADVGGARSSTTSEAPSHRPMSEARSHRPMSEASYQSMSDIRHERRSDAEDRRSGTARGVRGFCTLTSSHRSSCAIYSSSPRRRVVRRILRRLIFSCCFRSAHISRLANSDFWAGVVAASPRLRSRSSSATRRRWSSHTRCVASIRGPLGYKRNTS